MSAVMLAASEQIETDQLDNFICVGELALTGAIRSCKGVLPIAIRAKQDGKVGVLVPDDDNSAAVDSASASSCAYTAGRLLARRRPTIRHRSSCPSTLSDPSTLPLWSILTTTLHPLSVNGYEEIPD